MFAVDEETGRLTPAGHVRVGGKTPRHFTIDPTGRFVLAAHQGSGTIAVLRLDAATGMPALVGSPVKVDKPVCLLPAPAALRARPCRPPSTRTSSGASPRP